MGYTALYRKYRPSTFEDVIGQKHIVTTLNNALEKNRLAHAYLFSGPSGNGKTSIAKLFAKAINCTSETEVICDQCDNCLNTKNNIHPDIVEIDAASNNGVEEIRNIIEKVKYAPLNGKYKVYIIDEVHMLSLGAFNALLKTLEEPPKHVVFILATTEPHKVIPTIISRCQRYDFTRVSEADIASNIVKILDKESVAYEDKAVDLISNLADGGVRESLSILEQAIAYSVDNIQLEDVRRIYGIVTKDDKINLLDSILKADMMETLKLLTEISDNGNNLERLNTDLINILKESVIYKYAKSSDLIMTLDESSIKKITNMASAKQLLEMIDILMEIDSSKKSIADLHSYIQLGFIKMINIMGESNETVISVPKVQVQEADKTQVETIQRPRPEVEELTRPKVEVEEVKTEVKDTVIRQENTQPLASKPEQVETVEVVEVEPEVKVSPEITRVTEENNVTETPLEPVKEVVKEVVNLELDTEMLLSLLTFANKDNRIKIEGKWSQIQNYVTDIEFAKYVHKLKFSQLLAVGENYALIVVENRIVADDINQEANQIGISDFIKEKLAEELRVFAISNSHKDELIQTFRERSGKNNLPSEIKVEILKKAVDPTVKTLEMKAEELFGADGFIVEE
ncbi:MAG: DNA polymerase III subunit gamma/tau [Erysipelothrix sp.]|nr:DNA polymerase III subunit gamma/tau [Erysipelothrix sp.]